METDNKSALVLNCLSIATVLWQICVRGLGRLCGFSLESHDMSEESKSTGCTKRLCLWAANLWPALKHRSYLEMWTQLSFCTCMLSRFSWVQLFATPWTVAPQAPLSMQFSRQEHWSWLPFPPPWDLPNPGIEPRSLLSPALAGRLFFPLGLRGKPTWLSTGCITSILQIKGGGTGC